MKLAGYARVSTKEQSLESQIDKLRSWALANDHTLEIFQEKRTSAEPRPQFDVMWRKRDGYDGIVVVRLDRFGRTTANLLMDIEELRKMGKEFICLEPPIDTSRPEGNLLLNMLACIAQYERELVKERMAWGFQKAKDEGRLGRPKKEVSADFVSDYRMGASYKYLSKKYGISTGTVYSRLKETGALSNRD